MTATNSSSLCGYYGKVPARADFVGSRLRRETIERWDQWLQEALTESQRRMGSAWHDLFFTAPIWRFILPGGACGDGGLMGILMPSVDSVGRCFPLMLAQEIGEEIDPLGLMAGSGRWFAAAEELALSALVEGFELNRFNRVLPAWQILPGPINRSAARAMSPHPTQRGAGTWMALPLASARAAMAAAAVLAASWSGDERTWPGIWWTAGTEPLVATPDQAPMPRRIPGIAISQGLVPPIGFAALLDGCWRDHGWTVRAAVQLEHGNRYFAHQEGSQAGDWELSV
jgi:type VI secretion system protein ImpM